MREGEAIFVRNSRFQIVSTKDILMKEILQLPLPDSLQVFAPMLEASPDLMQALDNVGTVAQIAMLRPVDCTIGGFTILLYCENIISITFCHSSFWMIEDSTAWNWTQSGLMKSVFNTNLSGFYVIPDDWPKCFWRESVESQD